MTDPLMRFRDRFPILSTTNYLISNSLGAMPSATRDNLIAYADTWATRGVRAWGEGWWEMALATGDKLGPLLGTGPGETTFHQNVTLATAVFVSALDFSGDRTKTASTSPFSRPAMASVRARRRPSSSLS